MPFGIACYSDKLFISDWETMAIQMLTLGENGEFTNATNLISHVESPMGLFYSKRTAKLGLLILQ